MGRQQPRRGAKPGRSGPQFDPRALMKELSRGGRCAKSSYPDEEDALNALERVIRNGTTPVKPHRVYECELCGKWHMTSKAPKDLRDRGGRS